MITARAADIVCLLLLLAFLSGIPIALFMIGTSR